jgi:hypothetical protein
VNFGRPAAVARSTSEPLPEFSSPPGGEHFDLTSRWARDARKMVPMKIGMGIFAIGLVIVGILFLTVDPPHGDSAPLKGIVPWIPIVTGAALLTIITMSSTGWGTGSLVGSLNVDDSGIRLVYQSGRTVVARWNDPGLTVTLWNVTPNSDFDDPLKPGWILGVKAYEVKLNTPITQDPGDALLRGARRAGLSVELTQRPWAIAKGTTANLWTIKPPTSTVQSH